MLISKSDAFIPNRSFLDLQVGSTVYVSNLEGTSGRYEMVIKIGSKYGYLARGRQFVLATGKSVDKDGTARANGLGFDVWRSEGECDRAHHYIKESERLSYRLNKIGLYSMHQLPQWAVEQIHDVLDKADIPKYLGL